MPEMGIDKLLTSLIFSCFLRDYVDVYVDDYVDVCVDDW